MGRPRLSNWATGEFLILVGTEMPIRPYILARRPIRFRHPANLRRISANASIRMIWTTIAAPPGLAAHQPMAVRAQAIPARHYFPEHAHPWSQLVYAVAGVLTVAVEGRSFVI